LDLDLRFQNLFGPLGPERFVTLHWTAGLIDDSVAEAVMLCRAYHRDHTIGPRLRAGGIAYHFCLPRTKPWIILLRPLTLKGAHTGGVNTSNVGVMCHGGAGGRNNPRPTDNQVEALEALLRYGHTSKMPKPWRADRKLARPSCERLAHRDWPAHRTNACNGTYRPLINLRTR
jgi:hypothetical protein